jgi:D-mannonate dehydratase
MLEEVNFSELDIPIPNIVKTYTIEKQREIYEYLKELDDLNRNGYKIAINHLGSSFDICRSNGFKEWKNSKTSK